MVERQRFVESRPFDLASLQEAVKGRIDRAQGIIRHVKLMSLESLNGRRYRIPNPDLFNGVQVRLDHHGKENGPEMPTDPEFEKIWATTINAETGPDGVYADLKYNPKNRHVESILWWAENTPTVGGFSPVTWGLHNHSGGETVIDILTVESVDLVGRPATTRGFFESEATMDPKDIIKLQESLAALNVEKTSLATRLQESETARVAAEARAVKAEGEIAAAKAAEIAATRKTAREALITEAKLPAEVVTAEFREAIINAPSDAVATTLISTVQRAAGSPKSMTSSPDKAQESTKAPMTYEEAKAKGVFSYERS